MDEEDLEKLSNELLARMEARDDGERMALEERFAIIRTNAQSLSERLTSEEYDVFILGWMCIIIGICAKKEEEPSLALQHAYMKQMVHCVEHCAKVLTRKQTMG
jgi:hypothetical protein